MSHPLDGPRLKLRKAHDHLEALGESIKAFVERGTYSFTYDQEGDGGPFVFRLKDVKEPPPEWSLFIGDCVHNLRSSLDHLAYQLARLTTSHPPLTTEFPIFRSGTTFRKRDKKGLPAYGSGWYKVRALPRRARTVCERLQPYHGRTWPDTRFLWQLHELSNVDKHRLLHTAHYYAVGSTIEVQLKGQTSVASYEVRPGRFKEHAIFAYLLMGYSEVGAEVDVKPRLATQVIFDKAGEARSVRGENVRGTLGGIGAFIDYEVLPRFAPFFR